MQLASRCAAALIALGVACDLQSASAQKQFVAADVMYTATAENTMGSEYRTATAEGIPADWKSPVDYTTGTVYARYEIIAKPDATKTLYNMCFLIVDKLSCLPYPPSYTAKGTYNFSAPFKDFWQFDVVDWTKGASKVVLVMKDENGKAATGDPKFYPTTIHVTMTVVPAGGTYTPPPKTNPPLDTPTPPAAGAKAPAGGAGGKGAGGMTASKAGSGGQASGPATPDGSPATPGSSPPATGPLPPAAARGSAGTSGARAASTGAAASGGVLGVAGSNADAAGRSVHDYLASDSSCAAGGGGAGAGGQLWYACLIGALVLGRRAQLRRRARVLAD
jgi:hypothetical protein